MTDSVAARTIALLQKKGPLRTAQIAEALGVPRHAIAGSLDPYCKNGTLISCRVEIQGSQPQNEYRMSTTGTTKGFHADPAERKPPTQVRETKPETKRSERKPKNAKPADGSTRKSKASQPNGNGEIQGFGLGISDQGHLGISKGDVKIDLTPQEFERLRGFIDKTDSLWTAA